MDWQEQYETAADREQQAYETQPIAQLLEQIKQRQYGSYNMIWSVLAERATLSEAGWPLFDVLHRDIDYLIRCNCAEALLQLLGRTDVMDVLRESVNLTAGTPTDRGPYIKALEQELIHTIGKPNP
jgi:hypothetical protein